MVKVGNNVWVKCGHSGAYEELAVIQKATKKKITIKYIVSGIQEIADRERIRPMEDNINNGRAGGRSVRRSTRNSSAPANVTPTPTEIDSDSKSEEGSNVAKGGRKTKDTTAAVAEASSKSTEVTNKVKGGRKRKEATTTAAAETSNNKKAKGKVESPFFNKTVEKDAEKKSPYFDDKETAAKTKGKSETSSKKKGAAKKGRKLIMASSDDDNVEIQTSAAKKPAAAKKPPAAKKPAAKKRKANSAPADDTANGMCQPCGNVPDGNGGLNQPAPFIVEYSKTGRATCRTCDDRIAKGELRVGHTPLFRGKPGYMVFRHLHCTVFSEEIICAEDVENYADLTDEDYVLLANQVETSKEKIKEEMEELSPDELVQKAFQGEIRNEPPGLTATLLPFQIEGFSWMRHQEVSVPEIKGGVLADEMGLGKTLQTISTILDHRPMLQHSKPGMKHPPNGDLKARQDEEKLWEKAATDWTYEMDVLKVGKKLRPRDGGARAGTLVICPVIALTQWKEEILKFTDGSLSICTYHGPDREKETPRELMKKYDIVLTTYQVMEADFRKMTSPNRVECPNCGGKFKIDKLPIHLKYFCGENAQRTEAQSRQRRNNDRGGGNHGRDGGSNESDDDDDDNDKGSKKKSGKKMKSAEKSSSTKKVATKKPRSAKASKQPATKASKSSKESPPAASGRKNSARKAATQAATQISRSASDWTEQHDDESGSDDFQLSSELSSEEEVSDIEFETKKSFKGKKKIASDDYNSDSSSSSNDSMLERARAKQREALERAKSGKKGKAEKKMKGKDKEKSLKAKGKQLKGKGRGKVKQNNGKGKKKPSDDDSDDEYSSEDEGGDGFMQDLIDKAMAGAKKSPLHTLCWWRIVLDEAHMIKSRSSQTANAAFSLIGVHRWALSGSPIQNRVGEFYSLVRFLRLDPMAYYYCRAKDCNCKSMHYRMVGGICEGCNHGSIQHYSHFNKYVLNPIQRDGYTGDGRRAMFTLKNEVLDKALLRRTKETKAADLELPPRLVNIRPVKLHPVEEDFYAALYTQTAADFNDYVESGTLLNNYAHIFDLLVRMRQSVDHPYLVIHSKKGVGSAMVSSQSQGAPIANGSVDCDLCHEPPTDRVVSSCCGAAYCKSCVLEFMTTSTSLANGDAGLTCPSCRAAFSIDLEVRADIEDDSALQVVPAAKASSSDSAGMPSLKELQHVATGSILRRINLSEFATSSKIEALTRELVMMRQKSPGSKAIVFSQFVNMLDMIRWRLHSDPYLEDIGLSARALHGGMNVKARDAVLKEFREDKDVRVLLMSLKTGGVALNLTCANYIFLMDPWWNPSAEMQAIDRTHRLGQYRTIHAVRFIAENTVEERILQLQEKKRLVFDGTVGRDAGSLKMLTVDDMKSLFA